MRILSTHPESQGPFVIIEDDDFNAETMTPFEEDAPKKRGK